MKSLMLISLIFSSSMTLANSPSQVDAQLAAQADARIARSLAISIQRALEESGYEHIITSDMTYEAGRPFNGTGRTNSWAEYRYLYVYSSTHSCRARLRIYSDDGFYRADNSTVTRSILTSFTVAELSYSQINFSCVQN
jgi:hypothetical protein